jgi:hypothetical protein
MIHPAHYLSLQAVPSSVKGRPQPFLETILRDSVFPQFALPLHFEAGQKSKSSKFSKTRKILNTPKLEMPHTLQVDLFSPRVGTQGLNRFAVIGDAGSGSQNQLKIANQMAAQYEKTPFASVLVLGDNVYEDGEPHLFQERIYEPYAPLFKQGVRFFPVLGNHDVRKNFGDLQLKYWGAPNYYCFKLGQAPLDVECFAIDTTVYLPGYDKCYADAPGLALKKAEVQTQWLEKALGESKAKYKLVFGHYPLYSSGLHSSDPKSMVKLRGILEPILAKNKVDLYLAGHEHHYERSSVIQGIQHFVSGAAGRLREIFYKDAPPYPREKAMSKFHFMLFDITPEGLTFQALSKRGKVLDSGVISAKSQGGQVPGTQGSDQIAS